MLITPRQSFKTLFCGQDGGALLKSASISGSLQTSGIRSIAWIYFLGAFPKGTPEELFSAIEANRIKYKELVQHHIIDPRTSQELDPSINNPLSQVEDSPWAKFFQNAELEKVINQDLERCYPDKDFFQETFVRDLMARILFVYAKLNQSLSYRQGMHELLAPVIYLLHQERSMTEKDRDPDDARITLDESSEKILQSLLDHGALEADAFFIFKHLMDITGDWFSPVPTNGAKKGRNGLPGSPTSSDDESATTVVVKCRRIQHVLLKNKDPELHDHLVALKIEPQFYLLRWVRLLLGREFHLDDLIIIWDAVFAHSPDLVLVDYICVAMLVFIREQLLERDSTGCLTRLMKYPPVEDVRLFIEQAQTLISNRLQQKQPSSLLPPPGTHSPPTGLPPSSERDRSPNATHVPSSHSSKSKSHSRGQQGKALQPVNSAASFKHMLNVDTSTTDVAVLQEQLRTLRDTQLAVAQRIDGIVQNIQTTIMANAQLGNVDSLLLSLAELKQTKDILCGFLPATEPGKKEEDEDAEIDVNDHSLSDPLTRQVS